MLLLATQRHAALFAGVFAILAGYGLTSSLLSITLIERGLGGWVGGVGAAYFLGLGIGSLRAERIIAGVGYLRAYGMLTAVASLGTLSIALVDHPAAWATARFVQGLALGGLFICIESWLGSTTEPSSRGRVLGVYQVVIYAGLILGQGLLGPFAHDVPRAMVVATVCLCLAALPVGVIRQEPPQLIVMPRIRLRELWGWASVGVMGAFVSGITTGAVYTVAPAAGVSAGLDDGDVGLFMSAFVGGGMLLQLPLGRLSDAYDRRIVLGGLAALGAAGGLVSMASLAHPGALLAVAAFEGGCIFALYTIALAYTYDRVPPKRAVAANATLLAVFCVGSGLGSLGSSVALAVAGPAGFFAALSIPTAVLAMMSFRAARLSEPVPDAERFAALLMPRTSAAAVELDPRVNLHIASGVEGLDGEGVHASASRTPAAED
ncbi:MAG: MFS family permease [Myxococcota bacterium]|jgi:MFS family permease